MAAPLSTIETPSGQLWIFGFEKALSTFPGELYQDFSENYVLDPPPTTISFARYKMFLSADLSYDIGLAGNPIYSKSEVNFRVIGNNWFYPNFQAGSLYPDKSEWVTVRQSNLGAVQFNVSATIYPSSSPWYDSTTYANALANGVSGAVYTNVAVEVFY
jgi:hypothetical protein